MIHQRLARPLSYARPPLDGGAYQSCLTAQRNPSCHSSRPVTHPFKQLPWVVNAVMYVLSSGCQWRSLPKDPRPRSMVHDYLSLWTWDGTLDCIHYALYVKCREKAGRDVSPTVCIIDSQSVKSTEKEGLTSIVAASMQAS